MALDDAELGDFQKLLNRFNMMSSSTTSNNKIILFSPS
jgi:hypothetical protein